MDMMIVWLTGQSGAGKTTLAKELQKDWPCVILDGKEMRNSISQEEGFSRDDRTRHNCRVARLANELVKQMNVVITVIAPIKNVRKAINHDCPTPIIWVYVKRTLPEQEGHFYEEPDYTIINQATKIVYAKRTAYDSEPENCSVLNHDELCIDESVKKLKEILCIK